MSNKQYTGQERADAVAKGIDRVRLLIAEINSLPPHDLLTIKEAAEEINYSRQWLQERIKKGDFEVYGDGKRRFLYRPQLLRAMNIIKT